MFPTGSCQKTCLFLGSTDPSPVSISIHARTLRSVKLETDPIELRVARSADLQASGCSNPGTSCAGTKLTVSGLALGECGAPA